MLTLHEQRSKLGLEFSVIQVVDSVPQDLIIMLANSKGCGSFLELFSTVESQLPWGLNSWPLFGTAWCAMMAVKTVPGAMLLLQSMQVKSTHIK